MINKSIGMILRGARLAKKMTLARVAALHKSDVGNMSRLENNKMRVTVEDLCALADIYEKPAHELLKLATDLADSNLRLLLNDPRVISLLQEIDRAAAIKKLENLP